MRWRRWPGELDFPAAKPAILKTLAEARSDPELFALSYDFVGDLAETIALIWPGTGIGGRRELPEVIDTLRARRSATPFRGLLRSGSMPAIPRRGLR